MMLLRPGPHTSCGRPWIELYCLIFMHQWTLSRTAEVGKCVTVSTLLVQCLIRQQLPYNIQFCLLNNIQDVRPYSLPEWWSRFRIAPAKEATRTGIQCLGV